MVSEVISVNKRNFYVGMYKNQLQELAQRSCFNLPSYSCIREGPDHAPRFKATVNFNGDFFESPTFCSTLRQAEHAAAEVALNTLANRGPSKALAARVLVSIQLKFYPLSSYSYIVAIFPTEICNQQSAIRKKSLNMFSTLGNVIDIVTSGASLNSVRFGRPQLKDSNLICENKF